MKFYAKVRFFCRSISMLYNINKKTCDYFLIYEILSKFAKTELSITLNYNIT